MDLSFLAVEVADARIWVAETDDKCEWCLVPASLSSLIDKHAGWWTEDFTLELLSLPESESVIAEAEAQGVSTCTLNSRLTIIHDARCRDWLATGNPEEVRDGE